jgi:hypothetical protein
VNVHDKAPEPTFMPMDLRDDMGVDASPGRWNCPKGWHVDPPMAEVSSSHVSVTHCVSDKPKGSE